MNRRGGWLGGAGALADEGSALEPVEPPGCRHHPDLAYGPDPAHHLDLSLPPGAGPFPLWVMVHGGGWRLGDKAHAPFVAAKRAQALAQGAAVASVNYRLSGVDPLAQAADLRGAWHHLRAVSQAHALDDRRTLALGHSAGAHLLWLAALSGGPQRGLPGLAALVSLDCGVLDLPGRMMAAHPPWLDAVFGAEPAHWAACSPLDRLAADPRGGAVAVPAALLVASRMRPESLGPAQRLAALLRAAGSDAELLALPLSHAQINQRLGWRVPYTMAVQRFADRHLGSSTSR